MDKDIGKQITDIFGYVSRFYEEMAQIVTDLTSEMEVAGWDSQKKWVTGNTSGSLNNAKGWGARYAYQTFKKKEQNSTLVAYIIWKWETRIEEPIVILANVIGEAKEAAENYAWNCWATYLPPEERTTEGKIHPIEKDVTRGGRSWDRDAKLRLLKLTSVKNRDYIKEQLAPMLLELADE